jgi:Uma2 family endonuclease
MATLLTRGNRDYPTSDGKPMAETDWHRILMNDLIVTLDRHFAADPLVYVSGNLLLFYEPGNKRRHVSPDVFVVRGVPKGGRLNYILWEEGKGPDVVIELTSASTRKEDLTGKFRLYRDVLKVTEYFLFDPLMDYLDPPQQGHRLTAGEYVPIEPLDGRLPSEVLGLHLQRAGKQLRLYDPAAGVLLPTEAERVAEAEKSAEEAEERAAGEAERRRQAERRREREEQVRRQAEDMAAQEAAANRRAEELAAQEAAARRRAEARAAQEAAARQALEAELARLRNELAARTPPTDPTR